MKLWKLALATCLLGAFAAPAAADFNVCVHSNVPTCAGYTLDHTKGAVCYGVAHNPWSGPYVVVCTGDANCPTYYDVWGWPKGCTTDAGLGDAVFAGMVFVDTVLP